MSEICPYPDCYITKEHSHKESTKPNIACKGEGATHFACDCFIEREIKFRKVLEICLNEFKHMSAITNKELKEATKDEIFLLNTIGKDALSKINNILEGEK